MSQLFVSGGQSTGASASVFLMNIQDYFLYNWLTWSSCSPRNLKSLLQHHSSKASVLQCSPFFVFQLSPLHMTTRKTIALTIGTFVCKVMDLFLNMLSRFVITLLPRKSFNFLAAVTVGPKWYPYQKVLWRHTDMDTWHRGKKVIWKQRQKLE